MTAQVADEITPAEIIEAIEHANRTLKRMPRHWTDRRAAVHATLNGLLDDLEKAQLKA